MENKLIMATDLINALVTMVEKHGDCPVVLAESNSNKAIVPWKEVHAIEIAPEGFEESEKCIMIANFVLYDNDGNSMGYGLSK